MSITKDLYAALKQDNQEIFLELAHEKYREVEPHGEDVPSLAWLLALLSAYNAVTKYIYDNEVERKRAYTAEGINSSITKATEFRRGLSYWSRFTGYYADIISDESTLKAYQDAGVKYIRWNAMLDGKECSTCEERDGKVYPINAIPPKPHVGCRCYYTPAE